MKRENMIPVGTITWDVKPPYHHWEGADLTWGQYQKFQRLGEEKSLRDALDYALKVGKNVVIK